MPAPARDLLHENDKGNDWSDWKFGRLNFWAMACIKLSIGVKTTLLSRL